MLSTDLRTQIEKKLKEYNRVQEAISTLDGLDATNPIDSKFSPKEAAEKAEALGKDVNTIISDIEKIQSQRNENAQNYKVVLQQVKKVIIDIQTTKQTVTNTVTKINLYTQRMVHTLARLQETREYLTNTEKTFVQLLPALYMIQNDYTNQAGNIDDLKLLLGSQNISETLSYDDMMAGLSIKLDILLAELSKTQKEYITTFKDFYETRKQLKLLTTTYQEKIAVLEEQKAYLASFLTLYKEKRVILDKTITNLFETRAQLKEKIDSTISELEKNKTTVSISDASWRVYQKVAYTLADPSYQAFVQKKEDTREQRSNFFWWSVLPVQTVQTFFWKEIDVWNKQEIFNGIQLPAKQWQEIYAPADGFVYYVQDQDGLWINWMMILHNNWYISVYTSMQKIFVKAKDIVNRWQIIGMVGWQPGTRWAWWFSSSSSLNLQVYQHWKPIDPLNSLDLSALPSSALIPQEYMAKYENDKRIRSSVIDMSTVTFVKWDSDHEKRVNFLTQYAKAPYNDITLWENAAEGTNVDIDLGICIWYAETSLGRHFASANNIGNVGNNDRGDRVDKDSPLVWARAIYMTLNNSYLGWYDTIYELSWYGNKDGAIYASSEYNRQKNVSRCLSTIKWYIVPEDYMFRTHNAQ